MLPCSFTVTPYFTVMPYFTVTPYFTDHTHQHWTTPFTQKWSWANFPALNINTPLPPLILLVILLQSIPPHAQGSYCITVVNKCTLFYHQGLWIQLQSYTSIYLGVYTITGTRVYIQTWWSCDITETPSGLTHPHSQKQRKHSCCKCFEETQKLTETDTNSSIMDIYNKWTKREKDGKLASDKTWGWHINSIYFGKPFTLVLMWTTGFGITECFWCWQKKKWTANAGIILYDKTSICAGRLSRQ